MPTAKKQTKATKVKQDANPENPKPQPKPSNPDPQPHPDPQPVQPVQV